MRTIGKIAGLTAIALVAGTLGWHALAEPAMPGGMGMPPGMSHEGMAGHEHGAMAGQEHGGMGMHHGGMAADGMPMLPGQDAFGAIQEIVRRLDADPKTDWSKVDLEALRQHLVDMNEVTLRSDVAATPVEGGLAMRVTGSGRTLAAIQRMVPAHAAEIERTHLEGWSAKTETLPDGVLLTVTAADPKEVTHLRGLGFIGILVSGAHHQPHHLAIARGETMH